MDDLKKPQSSQRTQRKTTTPLCKRSRAIVVAPGHMVSLESALMITKSCLRSHKLPEPARFAHEYVNSVK
ncbi:MAG: endonuclease V [Candidatus Methanoperedens sp.]